MGKTSREGEWQEGWMLESQRMRRGYGVTRGGERGHRFRSIFLNWLCIVALAVILARLVYLQVITKASHSLVAETNHIEQVVVEAPRGKILDKNRVIMAEGTGKERRYPAGMASAHLVGYLAETLPDEIGCKAGYCYLPHAYIGRYGAEKVAEDKLRGRDGNRVIEVDAHGREVRELGSNNPVAGKDVTLTVDSRLQEIMARATRDRVGAVVALDLSGKVLGLYSSPSFDPARVAEYLADKSKQYFLDRAVAGSYPPGSVFKPVTAYAGLVEGKITPQTLIEDTGEIRIDSYRYGNWYFDQYGRKEGEINVVKALARSNDIFFYKTGEMIGVDTIDKWAREFGLGQKTGIELTPESSGFVPDRLWKERTTGEPWFLGNTYHLAIGQGDLLVTPLQIARMTAGVVSGRLCQVSVVQGKEPACEDLPVSKEALETVTEGMRQACAPLGTAYPFFDFSPPVLCKTGTAQHAGQNPSAGSGPLGNEVLPHAWITVAYPADNPRLILTVLLESAGEGSAEAGPVAREILEKWRDLGN